MIGQLDLATLIARAVVLLIAFTIHELAHAVTADYLGDRTPRSQGRISLNPIVHLDPLGTIMLLVTGFGWAKPVMVNPYQMRGDPRISMGIVAAAGPISNIVMAVVAAVPMQLFMEPVTRGGGVFPSPSFMLGQFVFINLILAFFNLIPVPPLDGSRILAAILPPNLAYKVIEMERYGFLLLLGIIFLLPMIGINVLGYTVFQPSAYLYDLLTGESVFRLFG
ncbi:MAG: site-2 protease family protein [Chloroflexota bacterium]|jgi:Zn-dependent protease